MTDENNVTISSYNSHAQDYIDGTEKEIGGALREWLDEAVNGLNPGAKIVEIGSGFGRDAQYLASKGCSVNCTDASTAFVDHLQAKGINASRLNVLTDPLIDQADLVLANAVLLHFTREQFEHVVHKIRQSLVANGRFAFTLKQGSGEEWTTDKLGAPRYFCYWTDVEVRKALRRADFNKIDLQSQANWLHVIAHAEDEPNVGS